jgi:hypothetical protein
MQLLGCGYWYYCRACDTRKFYVQYEIEVQHALLPPSFQYLGHDWLAWSYISGNCAEDEWHHICPQCYPGLLNRATAGGMSLSDFFEHMERAGGESRPEMFEMDRNNLQLTEASLSLPPTASPDDSDNTITPTSGAAPSVPTPEEQWQDHQPGGRPAWPPYHSEVPALHNRAPAGAFPYYNHEWDGPTMEHGYFFGDSYNMPYSDNQYPNIQVGYDYNGYMGYTYDQEAACMRDRNGKALWRC